MTVRNQIRIIVYRMHEKGLEVLLLKNPSKETGQDSFLQGEIHLEQLDHSKLQNYIEFETEDAQGQQLKTIAIEADWHDIPKIRTLIKHDVNLVKDKIKTLLPELEYGAYIAFKEAFKKTLPHEYNALKELKQIILDRNLIRNI